MITFKTIVLTSLGVLSLIGCKNKSENSDINENTIETSSVIKDSIPKEKQSNFYKTLSFENISFDIKTSGKGSIRQLSIQPKGLEIDNQRIDLEIDGVVVNAEIEDLNSDNYPEILIYTISAGSGSYGNVIGYSVNNGKSISQIYFPEISENKEASIGYMGHDEFTVLEKRLTRKFPVYKNGDPNYKPSGGIRQIQYELKDGEASRLFVIDKISDY